MNDKSKDDFFRLITYDKEDNIMEVWQQDFKWRKDGLSTTICTAINHALKIKPKGGRIELMVNDNYKGI